jgi:hypothetical protein
MFVCKDTSYVYVCQCVCIEQERIDERKMVLLLVVGASSLVASYKLFLHKQNIPPSTP